MATIQVLDSDKLIGQKELFSKLMCKPKILENNLRTSLRVIMAGKSACAITAVSSAYWNANKVLGILAEIEESRVSLTRLTILYITSAAIRNSMGDNGSPCRRPRLCGK